MVQTLVELPFALDRAADTPLSVQVARGLRGAIRNGFFTSGDQMPGVRELARALGTSNVVVTRAVRELVEEGLVSARPRCGIRVLQDQERTWRGHVLWLGGTLQSYYFAAREETVAKGLNEANLRLTAITYLSDKREAGAAMLRACLQTMGVSLVVDTIGGTGVEETCLRACVPLIDCSYRGAKAVAGQLVSDSQPAKEAMARHVAELGVRDAMVIDTYSDRSVADALATAGVRVSMPAITWTGGGSQIEVMERAGHATTRRVARQEGLPELLYLADDHLARGCLTALLEAGKRIPEDVQVIAHTNRGNCPVTQHVLTRIERNPRVEGQAILELIDEVCAYDGSKPCLRQVDAEFIVGDTTAPAVRKKGER